MLPRRSSSVRGRKHWLALAQLLHCFLPACASPTNRSTFIPKASKNPSCTNSGQVTQKNSHSKTRDTKTREVSGSRLLSQDQKQEESSQKRTPGQLWSSAEMPSVVLRSPFMAETMISRLLFVEPPAQTRRKLLYCKARDDLKEGIRKLLSQDRSTRQDDTHKQSCIPAISVRPSMKTAPERIVPTRRPAALAM